MTLNFLQKLNVAQTPLFRPRGTIFVLYIDTYKTHFFQIYEN